MANMSDKEIRDEALRRVMWEVGHTNNPVTRYISDAVAEKVVRDEAKEASPEKEVNPGKNLDLLNGCPSGKSDRYNNW